MSTFLWIGIAIAIAELVAIASYSLQLTCESSKEPCTAKDDADDEEKKPMLSSAAQSELAMFGVTAPS